MSTTKNRKIKYDLTGEGGGGKGGGSPRVAQEAANTLRATTVVRVLELLSEGPIGGLATGDGQSIFLNGTQLQNSDSSYNFIRAAYDSRIGNPSQPYMSGFPSASASVAVSTAVTIATPAVKTVSSATVDAVKVAVGLPSGLSNQNTTNGDLNGSSVQFAIDRKPSSSGVWEQVLTPTIEGKCVTPYERQYYVTRPSGSAGATWDVRVRRLTADATSAAIKNATSFNSIVEVQEVQLSYPNSAYVGIAIDAESVGNQIPSRAYLIKGLICQVPSNYNPTTGIYTGTWDGSFTNGVTDNPAWVLYDILTNTRYGMGRYGMTPSQIDKFSFYNAGIYCDGLVADGKGGTERRFTFNAPIAARDDMLKIIQHIAGMMNANLVSVAGLITVNQDRPSGAVKLVTKANTLGGTFTYSGSALSNRTTSVNVTWNDKGDLKYLPKVSTVTDSTGVARYGFNPTDVAAFGATTEGQALRAAKWILYTNLNQLEMVTFSMGFAGFDLSIGNVIKIYDEDYTAQAGAGKIVSATSSTVTLDRPVVVSGTASIDVLLPDGVTIENHVITNTAGTYTTLNLAGTWSTIPNSHADYIVTSAIAARTFRVTGLSQDDANPHEVKVDALFYNPNKYTSIESGYAIPAAVYSAISGTVVGTPLNMTFRTTAVSDEEGIKRGIIVGWDKPSTGIPIGYVLKYRRNFGDYVTVPNVKTLEYEIVNALPGMYDIKVCAININNQSGNDLTGSYTLDTSTGTGSTLSDVTNLTCIGGGITFTGQDLNVTWLNPIANTNIGAVVLKDFRVDVFTTADVLLRTEYIGAATQPGASCSFNYTYSKNVADGGPNRSVKIKVYCRDSGNKTTSGTVATFTNPAPAVVTPTASGAIGTTFIRVGRPTDPDFVSFLVWGSTTNGFAPAAGNLIYEGDAGSFTHSGLTDSTTWYYKAAAYDQFGKAYDGTGLNVSTQISTTTSAGASINEYQLNGVTWTPNSPTTNQVAWTACNAIQTLGVGIGATWAVSAGSATWTSGILYIYYVAGASTLSSTTVITTALASSTNVIVATYRGGTNLEIGDGRAYMDGSLLIAGTVGATQVVSSGLITVAAQINDAVVTNAKITDLNGGKITANTITADKLSVTSLSAMSATIGTLRTAASGARMEISDNVIKVYDANGVLRVQLGNLAL